MKANKFVYYLCCFWIFLGILVDFCWCDQYGGDVVWALDED